MTSRVKNGRAALLFAATASVCIAIGAAAFAEDMSPGGDPMSERAGRRPPPEAFSACEGKSEGAECSVNFHDKTIDGVCVAPRDEQLFCLPNDMPPPPSGGRPDGPPPGRIVM